MRGVVFLLLAALSASATAGGVVQADMAKLQPVVDRDEEGFQACGVRGVVGVATSETADLHDFSLMIRHDVPYGTLKAGKVRAPTQALINGSSAGKTVIPAPSKFWIAVESNSKAVGPIKVMPSESAGYILEIADFAETYEAIVEMIHGERMQFAIRYEDQLAEQVVSFSAVMPAVELGPLMNCLKAVTERALKEMEGKR